MLPWPLVLCSYSPLHISHNKLRLPSLNSAQASSLISHGMTEYPGEIKNKGYAKFGGGGQTSCIMGDVQIANEYLPGVSHLINTLDSKNLGVLELFQI